MTPLQNKDSRGTQLGHSQHGDYQWLSTWSKNELGMVEEAAVLGSPSHPLSLLQLLPLLALFLLLSKELSLPCPLEQRDLWLGGGTALSTDTEEECGERVT